MTTYQVPVIVTVIVDTDDDGNVISVRDPRVDAEGQSWAWSDCLYAFDQDAGEWHEAMEWPSYTDERSVAAIAAEAAWDTLEVSVPIAGLEPYVEEVSGDEG